MSGVSLQLTIDGESKSFPFSLTGLTSPSGVLEVKPNSIVGAELIGDFYIGKDPFFELAAGYDPDVPFTSRSIRSKSGLLDNPKNNPYLFQQVYGPSELTLRYWDDFIGNEKGSRGVLKIKVRGQVPKEKKALNEMLRGYLLTASNGQFLLDAFRGQLQEQFKLLFISGFSCEDDPLIHLGYIKQLVGASFLQHLDGIIRCPQMTLQSFPGYCRASDVRRLSNRNSIIVRLRGTDKVIVNERIVQPSFACKSNNVISTFLQKLVNRLSDIEKHLGDRINAQGHDYIAEKGRIINQLKKTPNAFPNTYVIPRAESDKEIILSHISDCQVLSTKLKEYLTHPVFAYTFSRHEIVFNVPFFEFAQTTDYQAMYKSIREYEKTSFYWSGDSSEVYRMPSFCYSEGGKDFWIRKYSMMYEYWCYLRMLETLAAFGFESFTGSRPSCEIMQLSAFEKGDLRIYLYHDVRSEKKYRPPSKSNFLCPIPPQGKKQTPDFVLIFEHKISHKIAILVLDAKSDSVRKDHMRDCWHYLDTRIEGRRDSDVVIIQSWVVFSGEGFERHSPQKNIETPPQPLEFEYDVLNNDDLKAYATSLTWCQGRFHATFSTDDASTMPHKFIGYLQTHVRRQNDYMETDHFNEFLSGQIKLMEQCLA